MGFWDEDRWTREFGYRPEPWEDNPYKLGYHIGQDIAGADWYDPVPALRSGTVVESGRSGKIGGYVVVRVGDQYDTYTHLNSRALPGVGTWISAGSGVAPLARSTNPSAGHNYTGSASTGPHLHFVVSTRPDTAYNPAPGEPIDPRPIIRSIINGSVAGGGATPFNQEEDEMASKQEIKDALSEVLASKPDAVLIHYSGEGRNGIYLAAPGFWHQFTAEQWTQFNAHGLRSGIRDLIPVNDRDFDVFKEIYTVNQGMVSSVTAAQIAAITKSVQDALKNVSVDAGVDDETIKKIANAAVDRLVARAAN